MIDLNSPINKLKMNFGLTPDLLRALERGKGLQLPELPELAAPVKGPSLFDRVGGSMMPAPQGMMDSGLLTDDDIKAARQQGFLGLGAGLLANSGPKLAKDYVSPMAALGQGVQAMQGAYKGAVDSSLAMRGGAQEYASRQQDMEIKKAAMQRAQQLPEDRKAIIGKYPMPDVGNPQAMSQWIDTVLPHFIEANDDETVARLSEIRKSLDYNKQQNGHWMEIPGPDGKPRTIFVQGNQVPEGGIPTYEKPVRDAGSKLLDEQRMFTRANMLGDDYRNTTKSIAQAADQYRTMVAVSDAAKSGSPQAQIALVFSFMKTLDPSSVVRESEYATAKNAAGVPERVRNEYNKLIDGHFLTPQQVTGFLASGAASATQWKRQQNLHMKTFGERAKRWKINPEDVTMDFFQGLPMNFGPGSQPAGWHAPMAPPVDPRLQGIPRKQ